MKNVNAKPKSKRLNRSVGGDATIFVVLGLIGAFMILPFVYAIVQSLKPMEEIFLFPPRFFVRNPTFENYYMLSQLTNNLWIPFSRYVFNSVFVSIVATAAHVLLASMAAYPLAKFKFYGSNVLFKMVVLALLFTPEVMGIPRYIIMSRLGMINTYLALILPPVAAPLGLFLMKQFMSQIPDALIEAARIDGASGIRCFWSVVMPTVKPAWLTLIIFAFQAVWNREGLQFIYNEELKLLPTILKQISLSGLARAGVGAAAAVILIIPPTITFIIVQSNVIETMAHSGIKA